jgi:hypothetical protein
MRSTKAFLIGAGTAYFLDPRQGRRRRHVVRDRSAAVLRRGSRVGLEKARFTGGHLRGLIAGSRRALGRQSVVVSDDATVRQRIRSEALPEAGISTREVEVEVEDGVATLRGSVDGRAAADELVSRVAKVPGVRDVAAMIRVSSSRKAA